MRSLVRGLLDLVFPPSCHVCTADTSEWDEYLCPDCLAEVWRPGVRYHLCDDVPFVSWIGFLGPYSGAIRTAVHEVKFAARQGFARHLGRMLGRRMPHWVAPPRLLVPVPASARTLARRGFNQAEEIARGLGEELGAPVAAGILAKRRETKPQRSLDLAGRFDNVQGCFSLVGSKELRHARVGLVDDVTTTGATLGAAARLLRAFGAREVIAFVLGRTPKRGAEAGPRAPEHPRP